ncbi:hypothetical protein [Actinophytocola sp.]|uniref:hypothetical protein n=1 Tax=Actinophytocola sp. TaxID=1872138 RepID=UPI002D80974C|nr:hypothetical protein [Actinophytocola sp.]HET9141113.1 hypothetical protein [Actinophytocola sp.]
MRTPIGLALAFLAACTAAPPAAAPSSSTPPSTLAAGEPCPVTRPGPFVAPAGVNPAGLFGSERAYGNSTLWVGGLGPGGVLDAGPELLEPDGAIGWKFGWWRIGTGELTITGHRLDAPAAPLRGDALNQYYGRTGFTPSGVSFPTPGCWAVTGSIGSDPLTFVTLVRLSP